MKQGKTEKAVFAKLSTQKVEKVELSSVSEVKSLTSKVEQDTKSLEKIMSSVKGLAGELRMLGKQFRGTYDFTKEKEKELASNLETSQSADQLDAAINDLERKMNDLGVSSSNVDEIQEGLKAVSKYENLFGEALDELGALNAVLRDNR